MRLSCHKTRFNGNKWKRENYEQKASRNIAEMKEKTGKP